MSDGTSDRIEEIERVLLIKQVTQQPTEPVKQRSRVCISRLYRSYLTEESDDETRDRQTER